MKRTSNQNTILVNTEKSKMEDPDNNDSNNNNRSQHREQIDIKDLGNQISYFNEYLKNRMDFIADIATSKISSLENPMWFYQEVLKGINKNVILLNRISGISANVKFMFEVYLNGKKVSIEEQNDFYVSMPNDVLGCHAFYIIIENIIRNICKHAQKDKLYFKLCIAIADIENPNEAFQNYYKVEIYPKFYEKFDDTKNGNEKFQKLAESESTDLESLKNKLNGYLNDSILNENNSLRDKALGTIEMDICSAYLRKRDIVEVDSDDNKVDEGNNFMNKDGKPNFLYVTVMDVKEGDVTQKTLVQNFHFRKPRQILVIDSENKLNLIADQIKQLHKDGIWVLTNEKYNPENNYPHEILVYLDDNKFEDFLAKNRNGLPIRVLLAFDFKGININEIPKDNIERKFERFMWEKYIKKRGIEIDIITNINDNCKFNPSNDIKCVFIDDHWYKFDQLKAKDENYYYEMGAKRHRASSVRDKVEDQSATAIIERLKYTENVFTKIVLIDERVQSNIIKREKIADKEYDGIKLSKSLDLYKYFLSQNLIIPNYDDADLNKSNFGYIDSDGSVSKALKEFISKKDADFYIIHLGVLEKMLLNNEENKNKENPIEYLLKYLGLDINNVIITSGRGQPKGLPKNIKFIPLSSIQNAVESLNDKFLLTQILYNARKYKY